MLETLLRANYLSAGLGMPWNSLKRKREILWPPISGFCLPDPHLDKWLEEKYEINYVNIWLVKTNPLPNRLLSVISKWAIFMDPPFILIYLSVSLSKHRWAFWPWCCFSSAQSHQLCKWCKLLMYSQTFSKTKKRFMRIINNTCMWNKGIFLRLFWYFFLINLPRQSITISILSIFKSVRRK